MTYLFPDARLYEMDDGRLTDDIPLYLGFAGKTGGPVVELGVGAGRVALPLAQAGYRVTGLDISPPMLKRGQERLQAEGLTARVHLIYADFRDPPLSSQQFALAFCAYNAFLHLIEGADQMRALRAWWRLLKPRGLLVIDVENPQLEGLALLALQRGFEPEETLEDPTTGEVVRKSTRVEVDVPDQVLRFWREYEGEDEQGPWQVTQRFEVRILFQREMALLLTCAGYEDLRFYGDYDLNPWEPESPRIIAVAARPEG